MKNFKSFIQPLIKARKNLPCSSLGGDCFKKAGQNVISTGPPIRLVHALVSGQGAAKGQRLHHAWNEIGDAVLDQSNGRNIVMRKDQYYKLGNVKQVKGQYASYSDKEALAKMLKHQHWGPWDLDDK